MYICIYLYIYIYTCISIYLSNQFVVLINQVRTVGGHHLVNHMYTIRLQMFVYSCIFMCVYTCIYIYIYIHVSIVTSICMHHMRNKYGLYFIFNLGSYSCNAHEIYKFLYTMCTVCGQIRLYLRIRHPKIRTQEQLSRWTNYNKVGLIGTLCVQANHHRPNSHRL